MSFALAFTIYYSSSQSLDPESLFILIQIVPFNFFSAKIALDFLDELRLWAICSALSGTLR